MYRIYKAAPKTLGFSPLKAALGTFGVKGRVVGSTSYSTEADARVHLAVSTLPPGWYIIEHDKFGMATLYQKHKNSELTEYDPVGIPTWRYDGRGYLK